MILLSAPHNLHVEAMGCRTRIGQIGSHSERSAVTAHSSVGRWVPSDILTWGLCFSIEFALSGWSMQSIRFSFSGVGWWGNWTVIIVPSKSPPQNFWGVKYLSSSQNLTDEIYCSRCVCQMISPGVFSVLRRDLRTPRRRKEPLHLPLLLLLQFTDGHSHLDNIPLYFHLWFSHFM